MLHGAAPAPDSKNFIAACLVEVAMQEADVRRTIVLRPVAHPDAALLAGTQLPEDVVLKEEVMVNTIQVHTTAVLGVDVAVKDAVPDLHIPAALESQHGVALAGVRCTEGQAIDPDMLHKVGLRPDDKDAGTVLLLLCPLDVAQQRRAVAVDGQVVFRVQHFRKAVGRRTLQLQRLLLLTRRLNSGFQSLRIIRHAVAHRTELLGGKGIATGGRAGRQRIDRLCHGLDALLDAGHVLGVDLGLFLDPCFGGIRQTHIMPPVDFLRSFFPAASPASGCPAPAPLRPRR